LHVERLRVDGFDQAKPSARRIEIGENYQLASSLREQIGSYLLDVSTPLPENKGTSLKLADALQQALPLLR
jgi:hypothetical protein